MRPASILSKSLLFAERATDTCPLAPKSTTPPPRPVYRPVVSEHSRYHRHHDRGELVTSAGPIVATVFSGAVRLTALLPGWSLERSLRFFREIIMARCTRRPLVPRRTMPRANRLARCLLTPLLALAACSAEATQPSLRVAQEPPPLPARGLIEGVAPGLPEVLRGHVTLGEAASKASVRVARYEEQFSLGLDADGSVASVSYPTHDSSLIAVATAAWGQGTRSEDAENEYTVWVDPVKRERVLVDPAGIHWTRYRPVAEFLGSEAGIAAFAATDGTLLGHTREELERHYGPLTGPSAEDTELLGAIEDRGVDPQFKDIMFGRLGMSTLDFPATEYADVTTTVHVRFDEEGKADHVWFDLPYGSHPTAAAEILDAATTKWLDDAPASDPSVGDAPAEYTFSEDPAILMHTTMERTWQVHIQVREDAEPQSPKKARKR